MGRKVDPKHALCLYFQPKDTEPKGQVPTGSWRGAGVRARGLERVWGWVWGLRLAVNRCRERQPEHPQAQQVTNGGSWKQMVIGHR